MLAILSSGSPLPSGLLTTSKAAWTNIHCNHCHIMFPCILIWAYAFNYAFIILQIYQYSFGYIHMKIHLTHCEPVEEGLSFLLIQWARVCRLVFFARQPSQLPQVCNCFCGGIRCETKNKADPQQTTTPLCNKNYNDNAQCGRDDGKQMQQRQKCWSSIGCKQHSTHIMN